MPSPAMFPILYITREDVSKISGEKIRAYLVLDVFDSPKEVIGCDGLVRDPEHLNDISQWSGIQSWNLHVSVV